MPSAGSAESESCLHTAWTILLAVGLGVGVHASKESLGPSQTALEALGLSPVAYAILTLAPVALGLATPILWGRMWDRSPRWVFVSAPIGELLGATLIAGGLRLLAADGQQASDLVDGDDGDLDGDHTSMVSLLASSPRQTAISAMLLCGRRSSEAHHLSDAPHESRPHIHRPALLHVTPPLHTSLSRLHGLTHSHLSSSSPSHKSPLRSQVRSAVHERVSRGHRHRRVLHRRTDDGCQRRRRLRLASPRQARHERRPQVITLGRLASCSPFELPSESLRAAISVPAKLSLTRRHERRPQLVCAAGARGVRLLPRRPLARTGELSS